VWLEHAFTSRGLPAPSVQIETNLILLLPSLIEENQLLSFVSRRHLGRNSSLREVRLRETTMRRNFALSYRKASYLSPAALRLADLLRKRGRELFDA
jgi:DNA-binding transcriptional LysR family regulator